MEMVVWYRDIYLNLIGGKACWEKRKTSRNNDLPKYLKVQCLLSISIVISDAIVDVNHMPVISTINGGCENLSLESAASCASLNHLGDNGDPYNLSKES